MSKTSSKITVKKSSAKKGKKWLIKDGRKVVGRSDTKAKAERSAGYRQEAIAKKQAKTPERVVKSSKVIRVM